MIPRPSSRRAVLLGLLVAATGCGGGAEPRWAVQHGTVDVGAAGIEGYQVWEFFGRKWRKSQDDKHHICALVQELRGDLVSDLDGCLGCVATYELSVTDLETDCAPEVQPWEPGGQAYGDVRFMAVGEVPATEADADPYPGRSLGWYQSWDGESVEFMGFAWHESVDSLDDPQVSGWTPGERYVLDPVYAWEL